MNNIDFKSVFIGVIIGIISILIIKDNNSVDFEDKRVFTPIGPGIAVLNTITGEMYMYERPPKYSNKDDQGWIKYGQSLIEE